MPLTPSIKTPTITQAPDSTPFQTGRGATPGAFGAQIGQAAQRTGAQLSAVGKEFNKIKNDEDERMARELANEFRRRKRTFMYDGTDTERAFYSLGGDEAVQAAPAFRERIDTLRQEVLKRSQNKEVKAMVDKATGARTESEFDTMSRFTLKEMQVAQNTAIEALLEEAVQDGARAWNDPGKLAFEAETIRQEIGRAAQLNGWGKEVTENKREEALTLLYKEAIIAALNAPDAKAAKSLLATHRDKMDQPVVSDLDKLVQTGVNLELAQMAADQTVDAGMTETGALSFIDGLNLDPEVRKIAESQVRLNFAAARRTEKDELKVIAADAFNHVWSGGTIREWSINNPREFEIIAAEGLLVGSLQRAQELFAKGENFAPSSDGQTLTRLRELPSSELAGENAEEWRPRLTQSEHTELSRMIRGANDSVDKQSKSFDVYSDGVRFLAQLAPKELKWGQAKQGPDMRKTQVAITNQMNAFIDLETQKGERPTSVELRAEARRLFTAVDVPGFFSFFGTRDDRFAGEIELLTDTERADLKVAIEDIPDEELARVLKTFVANGIPQPTEDLIEQFFGARVVGDLPRQRRLMGLSPR